MGLTRRRGAAIGSDTSSFTSAMVLLQLAHIPGHIARTSTKGLRTVLKAKALITKLLLSLQTCCLSLMLVVIAAWRLDCPPDDEKYVVLGVSHSWDDTTQRLRQPCKLQRARTPTQRIGQTIMVQKEESGGQLHVCARAEHFTAPPLQMEGKTAGDLRKVMLVSHPFSGPIQIEDRAAMHSLAGSVDAMVLTCWPDCASTNARWMKHVAGVSLRDAWPRNLLFDAQEVCLLHQIHRIKVGCMEAQAMVGLLFCFSKLARSGSLFKTLIDRIASFCEERLVVFEGVPPPDDATAAGQNLFDTLFDLGGDHHNRGNDGRHKSQLWKDVQSLLAIDNSGFADRTQIIHYCWSRETGRCCDDVEDCKAKAQGAYVNLLVSHCWPEGTLSRWTHVRTLLSMVASGFVCRGIIASCLLPLLEETPAEAERARDKAGRVPVEAAGAGESDRQVKHSVRKSKVRQWLGKPETPWQVGVVFLSMSIIDRVVYFLMTGGQGCEPRRPGTVARAQEPIHIRRLLELVRSCQESFCELLQGFGDMANRGHRLLRGMGIPEDALQSQECLRFMRRIVLKMSIGLFRRFELRLNAWPYRLWILTEEGMPAQMKSDAVDAFLGSPECCLGWFGSGLRSLFPARADWEGSLSKLVLSTWMRTMLWSIYGCEREHSAVRRLVTGVGPARNFTLAARDRIIENTRAIHLERMHRDPRQQDNPHEEALNDAADRQNPFYKGQLSISWENGVPEQSPGNVEYQDHVVANALEVPDVVASLPVRLPAFLPAEKMGAGRRHH